MLHLCPVFFSIYTWKENPNVRPYIAMWLHYTEKVLQGGTASVDTDILKTSMSCSQDGKLDF